MAELGSDIIEQILERLDVKKLLQCKTVCKSWHSLISNQRFIKSHLNHKCNNKKFEHRRILMSSHDHIFGDRGCQLVGSSNGLVGIAVWEGYQILVANPSIREVKKLETPQAPMIITNLFLCCGFCYGPSVDYYKVLVGFNNIDNSTYFKVLTLKSNVWKSVGEVKHNVSVNNMIGTLWNGALHWCMYDKSYKKKVIVSFDLSQEKFKVIELPDDEIDINLGVIEECLCILHRLHDHHPYYGWVLKKYNVKQSWEKLYDLKSDNDGAIHYLKSLNDYISYKGSFFNNYSRWSSTWEYFHAPIFVQSLVSPHGCKISKRKRSEQQE